MSNRIVTRHGLSGRGAYRSAGHIVGTVLVTALLVRVALLVALVALVVLVAVLVVRLAARAVRGPVAPAVTAAPVVHARVNDDAARAHRARMAVLRSQL